PASRGALISPVHAGEHGDQCRQLHHAAGHDQRVHQTFLEAGPRASGNTINAVAAPTIGAPRHAKRAAEAR
ncbi:hypothetical protein NKJ06_33620, partial [Mesorhizobium sp. M0293]|uniref:hypothetical protein n=1 Tax=Mesorhizobium sp. M0293 TaxID=2956930 RepID=UPI003337C9E2